MNERIEHILEEIGRLDTKESTEDTVGLLIDLYAECMAEMLKKRTKAYATAPRESLDSVTAGSLPPNDTLTNHVGEQYATITDKNSVFSKGEIVMLDKCRTETLGLFYNKQKRYQYLYIGEVVRISEQPNRVGLRCVVTGEGTGFDKGTIVTIVSNSDGYNVLVANDAQDKKWVPIQSMRAIAE